MKHNQVFALYVDNILELMSIAATLPSTVVVKSHPKT